MPFSQSSQLSAIVGAMEQIKPLSLLDVGTGMGQYGVLARNNLEYLNLFRTDGQRGWQTPKAEWQVRIDGIEGCKEYLTPVHDWAYNQMLLGNALDILPTLATGAYEMVIAVDILEHFFPADGLTLLAHLKRIASRAVLISTPKEFLPQEVAANPYENHRSVWTAEQLAELGFSEILPNDESWLAVYRHPT